MSIFSPEELQNLSALLLSPDNSNVELAYELLKRKKGLVPGVFKEWVLVVMLHSDRKLAQKFKRLLKNRFKDEKGLAELEKGFSVLNMYHYIPDRRIKELIESHERIRPFYETLVEQNPIYGRRYFDLAHRIQKIEKLEEFTQIYYQIALKSNPDALDIWFSCGLHQHDTDNYDEAKKAYKRVLELKPSYASAQNNLALIYNDEKNYAQAIEHYKKALAINPHSERYRDNLCEAYYYGGYIEEYETMIYEIMDGNDITENNYNTWANYLWEEKKDFIEAEKVFKKALIEYKGSKLLKGNLGEMYASIGRYDDALKNYRAVLRSASPEGADIYRLITMINLLVLDLQKMEDAIIYYKRLLNAQKIQNRERSIYTSEQQWEDFLKAQEILKNSTNSKDL